ncbi:MAG: glycoside hydrolase family 15 protein [Pseudomonadota bacterium]|nr:glycoside hydrolase family 15 protein [Pseudomonadota bacterium]
MSGGSPDPQPIEAYALIGDCETAALVGADGSIDWLCWPRFDAPACFAALLGDAGNGRWRIVPAAAEFKTARSYLGDSLILETRFETGEGAVRQVDFMPPKGRVSGDDASHVVRMIFGEAGEVALRMELIVRFGYGATVPWVSRDGEGASRLIAGPDMAVLRTPVAVKGEDMKTVADFTVKAGEVATFVLSHGPSWLAPPAALDAARALADTRTFWADWIAKGRHPPAARRSLITLKALTYTPTGGLVAAPTTSLPEKVGGVRNWDYRYCWVRDASLALRALMSAGYFDEARAWRDWLHRAVAGDPADMRIMYGLAGERRLAEWEAPWLAGYADSRPVRIGNSAHEQFQLDVYGEVMDAFHHARLGGLAEDAQAWGVQTLLVGHVAKVWREADDGIWEVRGPRRHFTFSKIMAWVAVDRAVRAVEEFALDGPADDWRALRVAIHDDVCRRGFDATRNTFVRAYDDPTLDASLLLIADLGFIAAFDPRFAGTVAAVERDLLAPSGLVMRYDTARADDGLPPGEGAFLACSFWLVNAYVALGRRVEAQRLFARLLALANDVGLLAEEYDSATARLVGNFPQAFSHVGLINAAFALGGGK